MNRVRCIDLNEFKDSRGSFIRLADSDWGIPSFEQVSLSKNIHTGTLRGMHAMTREKNEYKLVTCISGKMLDVIIDCRPESPDYLVVNYFELDGEESKTIVIPPGCIHGFMTLEPRTNVIYTMSAHYDPSEEIGIRWDDPFLGIKWPSSVENISDKDNNFKLLEKSPAL